MWDHVECIQEAAVIQNALVHVVGRRVALAPTESQGHGGAGTLRGARQRRKRSSDREDTERR